MTKLIHRIALAIIFAIIPTSIIAQTTFTQSAAAFNLDIGGSKDGGHAWADYDLDGDYDLVVNTNGRGYLLRNDGGSFTDVTATLAPDFFNNSLERTALFVDFNNDGYPDIFRNDHGRLKIYLQFPNANPTLIRFGNGLGGTVPNQTFTTLTDGMNAEGAGALDYDGDGDLDIFIDNHDFGIDILQNDGNGFFTHVTKKSDSPTTYNSGDPTSWPLGLAQDAVDGDYGSATDFNNDGWVDIVVRKQDQVDLFTNLGGTFQDGVDIDQAHNNNKGSVAFQDFDNDGDFDLFWTENGVNQIHRNNGDGTWTGLGVATGIPINFSGQMEGLACGDVDNDGDIDIYLGNGGNGVNNRSKLYLNQINNGGGAMNFVDSGLTFNSRNEGSTFIDIDEDGDLDLYVNKNGVANELWINNLAVAERANHLYIDILEDRDAFGLINLEKRFGNGATATILDCDGTVISGIREVNGGYGHGTQEPGVIHFGLPGGPNTFIVLEIAYPRHGSGISDRVIVRQELRPIDYFDGNINIITILPTSGNQSPVAQDDLISVTQGSSVTFNPLSDNGNGVDSDPDSHPISVIAITQPANGTAVLNGDGTITYTPNAGFSGSDPFNYTLEDSTSCTQTNQQTIGNVLMIVNDDNDGDGIANDIDLDDDNDGIPDTEESQCEVNLSPGAPPGSNVIANLGTRLYTDYGGYWTSAVGSINAVRPDNNSHLLAFEMGGQTYPTGVPNSRLIDTDSNGFFDLLDTDGDGTGDVALIESSWSALTPIQDINSGIRLEGALLDGNAANAVGPLLTSGGSPFNPYLSQGTRGLNMAYSIANIGNTWYFNIQGIQATAYGDGELDILLTQVAQPGGSTTNTVHLLDNSGNYIGNGVTVDWNTVSSIGNHLTDGYFSNDAVQAANGAKGIRFGAIELSEFNLTPAEISNAVALRLNISTSADPAFFVLNDQSFISNCVDFDTDGDGVPNRFDLDSDNDGILDAEEAGHGMAHTNGIVNGAVGTDGIPDAVQASANSGTVNYTIAESTDDTDTIPNYLDLDSDGDGIPDNVEAQTTTGYNPPNGTVDANGVFTNYTSGLDPTNTDTIDNPDYLDTNSDNEGANDTTEAGITLANADVDNDGLDDNTDATADYSDPGGTIDDPLTAPLVLPDTDGDAATTGDVDFRDVFDSNCAKVFASSATTGRTSLYELSGTTMTPVFTAPQNIGGLAISANGNAYYDNATFATPPLFSFNGAVQTNTGASVPGLLVGEAADATGNVYYVDNTYHLRRVNFGTAGAASDLGALIFDAGDIIGPTLQFGDMTFDGNGRLLLYSSVGGTGLTYLYVIDTTTLTAKNLGNVGPNGATGAAFDASGNLITTTNSGATVVSIDFSSPTLTGTVIGAVNPSIYDLGSCAAPLFNPELEPVKSVVNITQSQNPATLARAGDVLEYTIVVTNVGNFTTNNATFVDAIPTATTYVANSTTLNGNVVSDVSGDMPYTTVTEINSSGQPSGVIIGAGGTATITFRVTVDTIVLPAFVSNTATVTYPTVNGGITTTQTVDSNTTDTPTLNQADLSLTKTVNNASPDQGDTITFTITITNGGPSSPTDLLIEDVLPADVTFLNATPATGTATFDAGTRILTWDLEPYVLAATLGSNTITMTYTVRVDVCGEFTNQAEIIESSLDDPDSRTNNGN